MIMPFYLKERFRKYSFLWLNEFAQAPQFRKKYYSRLGLTAKLGLAVSAKLYDNKKRFH